MNRGRHHLQYDQGSRHHLLRPRTNGAKSEYGICGIISISMIFVIDYEYECKPLEMKKRRIQKRRRKSRMSDGLRLRQTGEVLAPSWTLMQP